jgi:prepilin-type N-terminal cleavage/methylation domain-containing protein
MVMRAIRTCGGFTLVETMVSVVILGLIAMGISGPYLSGLQSLDVQAERMSLDSRLRGRMEVLVGMDFDSISSGSEVVTVRGKNYTLTWTVELVDMNDDSVPESDAKKVTVQVAELPERSLTTLIVNPQVALGKI